MYLKPKRISDSDIEVKEKTKTDVINALPKDPSGSQPKITKLYRSESKYESKYVLLVETSGKQYIVKGIDCAVLGPEIKPDRNRTDAMSEAMYIFQEYYLIRCVSSISKHFAKPLGISSKMYFPEDKGETQRMCVEMLQEFAGESLAEAKAGNIKLIFRWMLQSAVAIAFLHSMGIAHMDIKPGNMAYDKVGKILKLIDLGSGNDYLEQEAMEEKKGTASHIVRELSTAFAPPEVVGRDGEIKHTSVECTPESIDIFTWAASFYSITTHKSQKVIRKETHKFWKEKRFNKFIKNARDAIEESEYEDEKIKSFIEKLILSCMEYQPEKRPKSRKVAEDIIKFAQENGLCKTYFRSYDESNENVYRKIFGLIDFIPALVKENIAEMKANYDKKILKMQLEFDQERNQWEKTEQSLSSNLAEANSKLAIMEAASKKEKADLSRKEQEWNEHTAVSAAKFTSAIDQLKKYLAAKQVASMTIRDKIHSLQDTTNKHIQSISSRNLDLLAQLQTRMTRLRVATKEVAIRKSRIPIQTAMGTLIHTDILYGKSGFVRKLSEHTLLVELDDGNKRILKCYERGGKKAFTELISQYALQNELCDDTANVIRGVGMRQDNDKYLEMLSEHGGTSLQQEMQDGHVTPELLLVWAKQALDCLFRLEDQLVFLLGISTNSMFWRDGVLRFSLSAGARKLPAAGELSADEIVTAYASPDVAAVRAGRAKGVNLGKVSVYCFGIAFCLLAAGSDCQVDVKSEDYKGLAEKVLSRAKEKIKEGALMTMLEEAVNFVPERRPTFAQLLEMVNKMR